MAKLTNNTPVQSAITPGTDDRNTWATHYAKYGAGGLEVVNNDAEMNAIDSERKEEKMAYNIEHSKFFLWNGTVWTEAKVGNSSVDQSLLDEVAENKAEIGRLKTTLNNQPTEIYSFRGKDIPTLPVDAKKGYYMSFYTLSKPNEILPLPEGLEQGTIFCINNESRAYNLKFSTGSEKLDNSVVASTNIPAENMVFLVMGSDGWITAFSGVIPASIFNLISPIKDELQKQGVINTLPQIQAQLKDRLHTFASMQTEFADQLHTIPDIFKQIDLAGYQKAVAQYGFVASITKPSDNTWLSSNVNMTKESSITVPSTGNRFLSFLLPEPLFPLVRHVSVDGVNQVFSKYDYAIGAELYKLIIIHNPVTLGASIKTLFDFDIEADAGSDLTLKGDESTEIFVGMTDLEFPTSIVETPRGESTTGIIKPYIKTTFPIMDEENPNASQEFKATEMKFIHPLKGYSDPNSQTGVIVEIEHNAYEKQHNSGYLAYMTNATKIEGLHTDEDGYRKGALRFDDTIFGADGIGITRDIQKKTHGIQEYDGKDPNVTGGTDFLIGYRVSLKGTAPNGGFIRIMLIKKNATPLDTVLDTYITDKGGMLMASEEYYSKGEAFRDINVVGVVTAKQLEEFKCVIITNITGDDIYLNDKEDGLTGLMIQALTSTEKTGYALVQYELDTGNDINFTQLYLGADRANLAYALDGDEYFKTLQIGSHNNELDGWGYYAVAQNGTRIKDKYVEIDNDFNMHHIFSADETRALRGKLVKVTTELVNAQVGYTVALAKYKGVPNQYPIDIFKSRNQYAPVFETGWELADHYTINQTSSAEFHTSVHNFTVPMDAVNYAILIYPETDFGSAEIKLRQLKVDVVNPFSTYYMHLTKELNEAHLALDKEYARFTQDVEYYYSLRYTLKNSPTAMPVGILKSGKADITIDKTINIVNGSAATGGEGALVFGRDGVVTINSKFRVFNENKVAYNTQFWWSKVNKDGTFTKIIDSDVVRLIQPSVITAAKDVVLSSELSMPEFSMEVKAGDKLVLLGQSDILDGGYLISYSADKPLIDNRIVYREIIAGSSDVGGTGVDLSGFTLAPTNVEYGIYKFINQSELHINIDIPIDVEASVIAIQALTDDYRIRPMTNVDYQYDPITKKWSFDFGSTKSGQVIIAFYA